jgi:tripartite ATP-independent transporter DctM subunit
MTEAIVIVSVVGALFGLPLFLVLAALALALFASAEIPGSAVIIEMLRLASSPILVAIPLFTFAGTVFAEGGAPRRMVAVTRELLGWMPGGLALVALVACAIFTAFTGASGVTIVAIGALLLPALLEDGYPERFSLGLLTTSGSLGLLFPPSLPLIIFAYVAGVAVEDLFLAGIVPGILLILLLGAFAARRSLASQTIRRRPRLRPALAALQEAAWEIPLPFLVLGGIYSGGFTVTEAASITAVYALVTQVFIYRDVKLTALPRIMGHSMVLVAGILVIMASAFGLTNYLIDAEVPVRLFEWMQGTFASKWTFLIALNIFLLIVGCLMDIFSALIVVVPLIVPIAEAYGVNLLHLGIIFLTNLEIGYATPPVGLNLFVSSFRFNRSIVDLTRACLPWLVVLLLALALITYIPWLSLALGELVRKPS